MRVPTTKLDKVIFRDSPGRKSILLLFYQMEVQCLTMLPEFTLLRGTSLLDHDVVVDASGAKSEVITVSLSHCSGFL
jgi:hypothetical protein